MKPARALLASFASLLALVAPTQTVAAAPAPASDPSGALYISIAAGADAVSPRPVVLPLSKAVVVDLPREARDVLLSNPDIADSVVRTARRVFIIGRAIGQTNAFFFDSEGRQIANLEIRVEPDVAPLNSILKRFAPNASVKAESVNGSLILTGAVKSAAEADRVLQIAQKFSAKPGATTPTPVVNLLAVESKEQVLVKVRVVEMNRTLIKQLGVNLDSDDILNTVLPNDSYLSLSTANGFSINGSLLGGSTATLGEVDSTGQSTSGALQAFERSGLLHVLAEPNLTAISGESAKFLAGGEFPVPVRSDDGEVTVEFKPYGIGLAFTPIVLSGGRISLKVSTEVSQLTSEGATTTEGLTVSGLQVRRAETTVEMSSGGSLMMAGLLHERTSQAVEGTPGAKELPVLGALFRSRDFQNSETELVILVTPYLVDPANPDQLRSPGDGFQPPGDLTSLFSERLNVVYRGASDGDGRKLQGPAGHVIQ